MGRHEKNDLDSPETTSERRDLVRTHPYLRAIYESWYSSICDALPDQSGQTLELGSGGGMLCEYIPDLVTSDVFPVPGVDRVIDARHLPFEDESLRAIVGTNVLHHIPEIERFFTEATRCLRPGGRLVFIEPWPTLWSTPIYRFLHHEPFDTSRDWSIPDGGPLTAANGALPWILLVRDKTEFFSRFPCLDLVSISPRMPFSYLLCGGLDRAYRLPGIFFRWARFLESPLDSVGLFALLVIERTHDD